MNMKAIRHLVLLQPYIDWTSHDWCIVHHKMMTCFAGFCNTCAPDANFSLQNALRNMEGSTILHMDGTATVCGQWCGRGVKAVVVTMACYGVPEGGSRRGAAPLPMAVALLTKADEACLTDVVNDLYDRLAQRYGEMLHTASYLCMTVVRADDA